MEVNIAIPSDSKETWNGGGVKPFGASYGKMMMWFFIVSDALTFSGFLAAYGLTRFKFIDSWPIADEVFTHFPGLHGVHAPMYYVALMTFILIVSSVTMVLAVDAGHEMKQKKVAWYMFATIIFGIIFVGSQAWEWKNFISGSYGSVKTADGKILQFVKEGHQIALSDFVVNKRTDERVQHTKYNGLWFEKEETISTYSIAQIKEAYQSNSEIQIRSELIDPETKQKVILSR